MKEIEMSPELIGAMVTAGISLLTALAAWLSKRSKDQREELEQLRSDYRHLRQQLRLADQWVYRMTRAMDQNGITVPPAPDGLLIAPGGGSNDGDQD